MYKAVFTDMDGTLLTPDHRISARTREVIQLLFEEGVQIIPISARPLHGMLHLIEDIFPDEVPVVSLNGSYIWHQGKIVHQLDIPLDDLQTLHAIASRYPVSAMHYSQMDWYAAAETPAIRKEQKITPVPVQLQPFETTFSHWQQTQTSANKVLMAGDEQVILQLEQELLRELGSRLNIFKSQPRYVEAMHPAASKTNAMQLVMDQYGWQTHEVIAIGDNYNDAGMIAFAGTGVVMGNAPDEIKALADFITAGNHQDGVALALEHFFADRLFALPL